MFKPLYLILFSVFAISSLAQTNDKPTWKEYRKAFIVDFGLGGIAPRDAEESDPRYPTSDFTSFSAFPNIISSLGANIKAGPIQYEIKVGYCFNSYSYASSYPSGGPGYFITYTHDGSISNHWFYIQPLGINFGKDHKWGSVVIGAFLRKNFVFRKKKEGYSTRSGKYWDGTTMVPVDEINPIKEVYDFSFQVGGQLGVELKVNDFSQVQLRAEVSPYARSLTSLPNAIGYTINVGYVFNLQAFKAQD